MAPPGWAGQLEQCLVRGFPLINEVVFYHPRSRTLLACDLAFHPSPEQPWSTRLLLRLAGVRGFGPTYLERLLALAAVGGCLVTLYRPAAAPACKPVTAQTEAR